MEVLNVSRMNRKNPHSSGDDDKWIPTMSVLVSFKGDSLPKEVSICLVKTKVDPRRNPMQCYNCYKFGHMAKTCRNKKCCSMCGDPHHDDTRIGLTPRCANCKGSHKSIDSRCQIYEKNKLLCEKMAYENMSYAEARSQIFGVNRAPRLNKEDFPSLNEIDINQLESNKTIKDTRSIISGIKNVHAQDNDKKENKSTTNVYTRSKAAEFFYTNNNNFIDQTIKEKLSSTQHQSQPSKSSSQPTQSQVLVNVTNKLQSRLNSDSKLNSNSNKESAHPPGNGFPRALVSRFLVPKNEAQCV